MKKHFILFAIIGLYFSVDGLAQGSADKYKYSPSNPTGTRYSNFSPAPRPYTPSTPAARPRDNSSYTAKPAAATSAYTGPASGYGYGVNRYSNGITYAGNFKDYQRSGTGTLSRKLADPIPGSGVVDEKIYVGEWLGDSYHGKGVLTIDGSVYEGNFVSGKKSGFGIFTGTDWQHYEGNWKDDKYDGHGILTTRDRSKYEGEFKDGEWSGEGVFTSAKGIKCYGNWNAAHMPVNCNYKEVYPNEKTKMECTYVGTLKDGNARWYYENGTLQQEASFKKGVMEGVVKQYYDNGKVKQETTFKNGELDGVLKGYYKNGVQRVDCLYRNGKLWGTSLYNTPNGKPAGCSVKEGTGKVNLYFDGGQLHEVQNFKNGVLDGPYKVYYENGKLWSDYEFKDGKVWNCIADNMPDGSPTGTHIREGNGIIMDQSPDGKAIISKTTYVNGVDVKTEGVAAK